MQWWPGAVSLRDLGADGIGLVLGLAAAVAAETHELLPRASRLQGQMPQP